MIFYFFRLKAKPPKPDIPQRRASIDDGSGTGTAVPTIVKFANDIFTYPFGLI